MTSRTLGPLFVTLFLVSSGCSEARGPGTVSAPPPKPSAGGEAPPTRPATPGIKTDQGGGRPTASSKAGNQRRTGDPSGKKPRPRSQGSQFTDSTTRDARLAVASARRSDPSGDPERQGDPPAYADIRRATVAGRGGTVAFRLEVDGSIPAQRLDEGVDMTASFHFKMRNGDEHQIYAIGSKSGWQADLDNSGEFPGRFALEGDTFVFELAWTRLGGISPFKWLAQTSWTRAAKDALDETDFAFDQVPEYEKASYPE